jgi:hypothetical protein
MSTDCGFCPLFTKIGRCRNFNSEYHERPSGGNRFVPCGKREGWSGITEEVLAVVLQVHLQSEVHVLNESPRQEGIWGSVDMTGLALAGSTWLASHHTCFITREL